MATILETDRLRLRKFTQDDFENLCRLHSDAEVMRFSSRRTPESVEETAITLKRIIGSGAELKGLGFLAAELKSTNEFIGWFGMVPLSGTSEIEVGYRILRKFWGNGFATEGTRELVIFGFEGLGLKRIVAISDLDNIPSKRVLHKSGFKYTGDVEYQASPEAPKEMISWFVIDASAE